MRSAYEDLFESINYYKINYGILWTENQNQIFQEITKELA